MKKLVLPLLLSIILCKVSAQDTLPRFSIRNVGGNHIIIGWTNNFDNIHQLSIQRSFDSLTGYKSIMTVPDPTTPQNGYVDTKAPSDHMFYRLYILLEKGYFLFSEAKRPLLDTIQRSGLGNNINKIVYGDSIAMVGQKAKFKDNTFTPSLYVYTNKDGYIRVNLPDDENSSGKTLKKYSIKFYEDDGSPLFELKDIKEQSFKIDKTDFYHAGWFKFELFEDGKLIEKHKFYLEKDF